MLEVEPERVEPAVLTQKLDQLGAEELPEAEHADHLAFARASA